tara:strand:- start:149 stop:736 length:588 start_codon:yes stop_codon:yes gene_type:complete
MANDEKNSNLNESLKFFEDFMKSTKIQGINVPSLSVEEINKQIKDLQAVEGWLKMNMNMLRATIQTLQVQSSTLSNLQSLGKNFFSTTKEKLEGDVKKNLQDDFLKTDLFSQDSVTNMKAMTENFSNPLIWWQKMSEQFSQIMEQPEKNKSEKKQNLKSKRGSKKLKKTLTGKINPTAKKSTLKKTNTTARKKSF